MLDKGQTSAMENRGRRESDGISEAICRVDQSFLVLWARDA